MILLLACAHPAPPADPMTGWEHSGSEAEGFGRSDTWCTGATDCAWAEIAPGLRRRVVRDEPAGRTYEAVEIPADGSWGVRYRVEPTGQFSLTFLRYAGARRTDELLLGDPITLQIEQTEITTPAGPLATTDAARFTAWGIAAIDTLEAHALAELAAGRVQRCSYHRYLGDGSPICDLVALPESEVRQWSTQVHDEAERARSHLRDDGATLYALWRSVATPPR